MFARDVCLIFIALNCHLVIPTAKFHEQVMTTVLLESRHKTAHTEHVSLISLPALISSGNKSHVGPMFDKFLHFRKHSQRAWKKGAQDWSWKAMVPTSLFAGQGKQSYNKGWKRFEWCHMAWTKASRLQSSHVLAKHLLPSQLTFLRSFCKFNCKIKTASSPVHWVLWHDFDTSRKPDVYEFQQLLFGNNLTPFCSQYILPIHTKTQTTDFREAADTGYVNDVLDLCKTIESAQHLQHQLSDLLALAGFKLRKWSSNEPAVIKHPHRRPAIYPGNR